MISQLLSTTFLLCIDSSCTCAAEILNRPTSYSWPFLKCRHLCPLPQGVFISEKDKLSYQKPSFTISYLSWAICLACSHHHSSHCLPEEWAWLPCIAWNSDSPGRRKGLRLIHLTSRGVPHLDSTPTNAEISGSQCHGTAYLLNSNTMSQGIHGKGCS